MKAVCIAKKLLELDYGKVYDVLEIETMSGNEKAYRVVDESGEDYLYSERAFRVIED